MLRFRRLTAAPQDIDDDEFGLTLRLHNELSQFDCNAKAAGLPWIDKQMYREQLLNVATISTLPRVSKLNRTLERQATLSREILERCAARENLINDLLMTCAFDHSHQPCAHDSHRSTCDKLRKVDDETDKIIDLILEWRKALSQPLPFFVDGENYLIRMHAQVASGKGLAHVGAHLRSTCRHLPYYYCSLYDPAMIESNRVLHRPQLGVLNRELELQAAVCEESLRLARMGMYQSVLKLRWSPLPNAPSIVMIDTKRWKQQLILSYANALMALSRHRPVQDSGITSAMMEFAGVATKVMHKRYYLLWLQFRKRRVERRRAVHGMAMMADMMLLQGYMSRWLRRLERVKALQQLSVSLFAASNNVIRRRYMQKLFLKTAMKRATRLVKRAMMLRYFRTLQYHASQNILNGTLKHERGGDSVDAVSYLCAAKRHVWLATMGLYGSRDLAFLQLACIAAARTSGAAAATSS